MFWVIYIIIGIIDFILIKLIIKKSDENLFNKTDIIVPIILIIGPFIPFVNLLLFLLLLTLVLAELKWHKILYKIYGKK